MQDLFPDDAGFPVEMQRSADAAKPVGTEGLRGLAVWMLLATLSGPNCGARGQMVVPADAQTTSTEEKAATLHVYVDLIQVPVLVLDPFGGRMKPVDPAKFRVSLDSGPAFQPKHVRQEGEDPIALGILIDRSHLDGAGGWDDLDVAIASLASGSSTAPAQLDARDHVWVYGLDCELTRGLNGVAANPAQLKAGVDAALER